MAGVGSGGGGRVAAYRSALWSSTIRSSGARDIALKFARVGSYLYGNGGQPIHGTCGLHACLWESDTDCRRGVVVLVSGVGRQKNFIGMKHAANRRRELRRGGQYHVGHGRVRKNGSEEKKTGRGRRAVRPPEPLWMSARNRNDPTRLV